MGVRLSPPISKIKVLAALHHPFMIGMYYSFQTPKFCLIAMEVVRGGSLDNIYSNFSISVLDETQMRFYAAEIIEALHYIHGFGMVYQCLNPANVLISKSGHVKLADFGGYLDVTVDNPLRYDDNHIDCPKKWTQVKATPG